MMKKEAKSSDAFKKLAVVKKDRSVYKNRPPGDKVKTEKMYQASQSADCEVKFEDL